MCRAAVLLSTYCGRKHIDQMLESLSQQKFDDFVLYVRDDGSSDDTVAHLRSYDEKLKIILIESTSRIGAAHSFMSLLHAVPDTFDYYFYADQDDYWLLDKIERAASVLDQYSMIPALYCGRQELVDSSLNHLAYSRIPTILGFQNALVECVCTGCATAFNLPAKKLLTRCPPENFFMHDWWTYLVVSAFGKVVYDDQPVIKYRQHGENVVGAAHGKLRLIFNRIKRIARGRKDGIFFMSVQAKELLRCYGDMLDSSKAELLMLVVGGKKSFPKRLRLVFSRSFRRQSLLDDLLLRLVILFNMY